MTYTEQGYPLVERRSAATTASDTTELVTTWAYRTQAVRAGSTQVYEDTPTANGGVSFSPTTQRNTVNTLYTISDLWHVVAPNGNKSGGDLDAQRTTFKRDWDDADAAGVKPTAMPCAAGPNASPTNSDLTNTGLLCEIVEPGDSASVKRTTRIVYDQAGRVLAERSPKANAERALAGNYVHANNAAADDPYFTTYSYYLPTEKDLSQTRTAEGWLRGVTEPKADVNATTRNFVVFAYDAAGNTARTWDRNATASSGHAITSAKWSELEDPSVVTQGPPSSQYSETLHADTVAVSGVNRYKSPWRYVRTTRTPEAETTTIPLIDKNGNALSVRPPKGNPEGAASVDSYDVVSTYDAGDLLKTRASAEERADSVKWRYVYDARENLVAVADPLAQATYPETSTTSDNGHVTVITYDSVDRPIKHAASRGVESAGVFKPAACDETSVAPMPSNRVVCYTSTSYFGTDNVKSTRDAEGQNTLYFYDAAGRTTATVAPRDGTNTARTEWRYDANGNVEHVCTPRQFDSSEPHYTQAATCVDKAVYGAHTEFLPRNLPSKVTTYEDGFAAANERVTAFAYDRDNNLTESLDPRGQGITNPDFFKTKHEYNYLGRHTKTHIPRVIPDPVPDPDPNVNAEPAWNSTSFGYDASGNRTTVLAPENRRTLNTYDADNRLVDSVLGATADATASVGTATGATNTRTRRVYDTHGNVVAVFPPNAFEASVEDPDERFMLRTDFDRDDRPVKQWQPRYEESATSETDGFATGTSTQKTQCPLDAAGSVEDEDGYPDTLEDYPSSVGVCLTKVDYDAAGRTATAYLPTAVGSGSSNRKITFGYTEDNLLQTQASPDPRTDGTTARQTTTFKYDGAGRVGEAIDSTGRATVWKYWADGLVRSMNAPDELNATGVTDDLKHVSAVEYNRSGQVVRTIEPKHYNHSTENQSASLATKTTYGTDGRVRSVSDPLNHTTRYDYDKAGNTVGVHSPNDTTANNARRTTNYFSADNLLLATTVPLKSDLSEWRRTRYEYDAAGRQISEQPTVISSDSLTATATAANTQPAIGYAYFDNDRPSVDTGNDGSTITRTYEPSGGLQTLSSTTGEASSSTATYYLDGLLRDWKDFGGSSATPLSENQYEYDASGAQTLRVEFGSTNGGTTWDERSRTTTVMSDAGQTRSISNSRFNGGSYTSDWLYSYDETGLLDTATLPTGQTTEHEWHDDDTLERVTLKATNGDTVTSNAYEYDENRRVIENKQSIPALGAAGTTTQSYVYDNGGRLTSYQPPSGAAKTFLWDDNDNRTNDGDNSLLYRPDNSIEKKVGGTAFEYFPFGGIKTDECGAYEYDGFSREKKAPHPLSCGTGSVETTSDGLGRRWKAKGGTGPVTDTYGFDGPTQNVARHDNGTSTIAYVVDAHGAPLAMKTDRGTSQEQLLLDDGHGSVATILLGGSNAGARGCTVTYSAFGDTEDPEACGEVTSNQRWYLGAQRDPNTKSYRFGSRTYQPGKAAFTTPDSMGGGGSAANLSIGTDPLTLNRFTYVNGDPINYWDPDGHGLQFKNPLKPLVDATVELLKEGAERAKRGAAKARKKAASAGKTAVGAVQAGADQVVSFSATMYETTYNAGQDFAATITSLPEIASFVHQSVSDSIARYAVDPFGEINHLGQNLVGAARDSFQPVVDKWNRGDYGGAGGALFTTVYGGGVLNKFTKAARRLRFAKAAPNTPDVIDTGDLVDPPDVPVTHGGAGPVSQGAAGVERTIADLERAGGRVLGKEISLDVDGVRTRPDLFAELPNGQQVFIEVKTGPRAGLTRNQSRGFPNVRSGGAVPVGANALAAGLAPGVPLGPTPVYVVHQPRVSA